MAYTPNATDVTQPVDTVEASTAAAEFRTLKTYLAAKVAQLFGISQTLQDVSGSRVIATPYTNTTDKAIFVSISLSSSAAATASLTVGSVAYKAAGAINEAMTVCGIVPPGATYTLSISAGTATITNWVEFRT